MATLLNKAKIALYFILVGWFLWIYKIIRENIKLRQQLTVKDFDLKSGEIKNEIDSSSIDDLVKRTNQRRNNDPQSK